MQSTGILVAGMHRSGTSATTGVLGMLGVTLGQEMLRPDANNRKGYWEHARAAAIHERLLTSLGRRWDDVRSLPAGWLQGDAAQAAKVQLKSLIAEEFADVPVWAVKDPRICRFMPLWLDVLSDLPVNPVVLFVVRRPSEVAASIKVRDGWPEWVGTALWLRHVLEAEQASRHLARTVLLYEDLVASPLEALTTALAKLDVTSLRMRDAGDVHDFIDAGERHHWHPTAETPSAEHSLQAIAHSAYDLLARTADDANAWRGLELCAELTQRVWKDGAEGYEGLAVMAARLGYLERMQHTEIAKLKSEAAGREHLRDNATRLAERAAAVEAECRTLQSVQGDLRDEVESLKSQSAEREAHLRTLEEEVARLQGECKTFRSREEVAERIHHRMAAERDRLEEELKVSIEASQAQTRMLNIMREERNSLRKAIVNLESQIKAVKAALADARRITEAQSDFISLSQRNLAEAVDQRDDAITRVNDFTDRLQALTEEHERVLLMLSSKEDALFAMRSSKSWRITGPLRALARAVRQH